MASELCLALAVMVAVIGNHALGVWTTKGEFLIPSIFANGFLTIGLYKGIFVNDKRMQWFYASGGVLIFMLSHLVDYLK